MWNDLHAPSFHFLVSFTHRVDCAGAAGELKRIAPECPSPDFQIGPLPHPNLISHSLPGKQTDTVAGFGKIARVERRRRETPFPKKVNHPGSEEFLVFHVWLAYPACDETAPPGHSKLLSMLRSLRVCACWCGEDEDLNPGIITRHF
jgi:hypothetical protein